ncbi:MAG: hypothetical protein KTR20_12755 [Cellvibrionaceae bacterium]|nr:hypothetical protein [Cellvibrionaceae bacterium]
MSSDLVKQLIAANEGVTEAKTGDIFYRAAERIDFLERKLKQIEDELVENKDIEVIINNDAGYTFSTDLRDGVLVVSTNSD